MFAVTERFTIEAATGRANYEMSNPCINNGPFLFPPPMDKEHSLNGRYELPRPTGNFTFSLSYTKTGPMQTHPGGFTPEELASITCFATPAAAVFPSTFIDSRYEVPSYDLANLSRALLAANDGKWTGTFFVQQPDGRGLRQQRAVVRPRILDARRSAGRRRASSAPPRQAVADYRGRPREYGITFQYNFF